MSQQPQPLSYFLRRIHEWRQNRHPSETDQYNWDCRTTEAASPPLSEYQFEQRRSQWNDCCWRGDWYNLFRMAVQELDEGRRPDVFINAIRLREFGSQKEPSGYTALHQAAWNAADREVVKGLLDLGAYRYLRTLKPEDGTPLDIATKKGHTHLLDLLKAPNKLPHISRDEMAMIQHYFNLVVYEHSHGLFQDPETMLRIPELSLMRELGPGVTVGMNVPGMRGGFIFEFKDRSVWVQTWTQVIPNSYRTIECTSKGVFKHDS